MATKMKNIISIKTIFLISILLLTIIGFNKFSNDMMESIFLENAVNDDFGSSLGTTLYLKDMNGEIITVGSVEEFERYFSKSRIRLKREYSFVVDFSEINKFKEKTNYNLYFGSYNQPEIFKIANQSFDTISNNYEDYLKQIRDWLTLPINEIQILDKNFDHDKSTIYPETIGVKIFNNSYFYNFYRSSKKSKCLIIYHEGHGGKPENYLTFANLVLESKSKDCDVLALSMLGMGYNLQKFEMPTRNGIEVIDENQLNHKEFMNFYFNVDGVYKSPLLPFFIYQHEVIKFVIESGQYEHINFLGFSGGGWNGLGLGILTSEIDKVILIAGSLPRPYLSDGFFSSQYPEPEQTLQDFYDRINYWDLYFMLSHQKEINQDREVFFVYNSNDSCCYRDPELTLFKEVIEEVIKLNEISNLSLKVYKSNSHEYYLDDWLLNNLFQQT